MDDRLRDADTLLKALGEIADQASADFCQPALLFDPLERAGNATRRDAVQARAIGEKLVDAGVAIDRRVLGQVTEIGLGGPWLFQNIVPGDADLALAGCEVAGEQMPLTLWPGWPGN